MIKLVSDSKKIVFVSGPFNRKPHKWLLLAFKLYYFVYYVNVNESRVASPPTCVGIHFENDISVRGMSLTNSNAKIDNDGIL